MPAAKKQAEAKARTLAANVYVDGVLYSAGDAVPADVAERITNPKAWGEQPDSDEK